jgi:hypothetical protein
MCSGAIPGFVVLGNAIGGGHHLATAFGESLGHGTSSYYAGRLSERLQKLVAFGFLSHNARIAATWLLRRRSCDHVSDDA